MAAAPPLSAELERELAAHRENRGVGVSTGSKQKQFTASIDEDAAQRWRKRSSQGEAGVHCIEVPLREPEKPISEFPIEMKHKLHEEYVASYLQDKIGVHPSVYNTKLARAEWPVRLQDTEVTATFKSRGNQGDKLFMTPSTAATTMPQKQLIKGEEILSINMVARPSLAPRAAKRGGSAGAALAGEASANGAPASAGEEGGDDRSEAAAVSFDDFKQKFIFPFYLRAKVDSSGEKGAVLYEQYRANRASRKTYGQGPPRDLIKAHEERNARKPDTAGTSTSRGSRRRPGRVDSTSLTCDGIPWNPFIDEDLEVIAEGRKPIAVTLHQVKGVQELVVKVLEKDGVINDIRSRVGMHELKQLVDEIRAMSTTRLITRLVHFLCHKLMDTVEPHARASRGAASEKPGSRHSTASGGSPAGEERAHAAAGSVPPKRTERDSAWESSMFVKIYEGYADMYARLRQKRSCTLFHLPVMLLCVRGACETLFRDVYPSYTKSAVGRQLLNDVDAAVAAMFDPDNWHSKISIFESSVDAMRIVRDQPGASTSKMSDKVYGTSPVIRSLFAGDFSSAFTKRQASVAAATSTPHDPPDGKGRGGHRQGQGGQSHALPMEVRKKLFRSALQRVTQRARQNGVVIRRSDGRRMSSDNGSGSARSPTLRHGDGPYQSDPDDQWLFVDPDDSCSDEASVDDGASDLSIEGSQPGEEAYRGSWEKER
jgi:hypothetical protein